MRRTKKTSKRGTKKGTKKGTKRKAVEVEEEEDINNKEEDFHDCRCSVLKEALLQHLGYEVWPYLKAKGFTTAEAVRCLSNA